LNRLSQQPIGQSFLLNQALSKSRYVLRSAETQGIQTFMEIKTSKSKKILLLVAGAKGAIGTTLAAAVAAMQENPQLVLPGLTTADKFDFLGDCPCRRHGRLGPSNDDITGCHCPPRGIARGHVAAL
jgi:hypothetical protein